MSAVSPRAVLSSTGPAIFTVCSTRVDHIAASIDGDTVAARYTSCHRLPGVGRSRSFTTLAEEAMEGIRWEG